jgi:hypothetical protein
VEEGVKVVNLILVHLPDGASAAAIGASPSILATAGALVIINKVDVVVVILRCPLQADEKQHHHHRRVVTRGLHS